MKYLFIVQGEGRGHLTQAISLSQLLRGNGHEVVDVLVGRCSNRELPSFFIEKIGATVSRFDSPSIDYGSKGKDGSVIKTLARNLLPAKVKKWRKSVDFIAEHIKSSEADVVVNFYELLMGFTNLFHNIKVPTVSLAHQFLIDHEDYAHRSTSSYGQFILRLSNRFTNWGSSKTLALSLYSLNDDSTRDLFTVPPLLRREIFEMTPQSGGYILGYMLNPAYLEEVVKWKRKNPECEVHIFWDKKSAPEEVEHMPRLWLHRIDDRKFLKYMERCDGYISTAGFESICEAMYLGKPTLMIPAHLEQRINAIDAQGAGAGVESKNYNIGQLKDFIPKYTGDTEGFRAWVKSADELYLRHLTEDL